MLVSHVNEFVTNGERTGLKIPTVVVSLVGLFLGVRTMVFTAASLSTINSERELVAVGLGFTFFVEFLFIFVLWFFAAGTMHSIATFVFDASGTFHDLFSHVGSGFLPQVFGTFAFVVGTGVAILTLDGTEIQTIVAFQSTMRTHPAVVIGTVAALGSILWSGYLWTKILTRRRALTSRQAICCTSIPVVLFAGTILYMAL